MSNREQLFENYEDALFAILMDDLAQTEGERLLELNHQLQNDPDAAVPADVQQRCVDVINREFAKKKRVASVQRAKKVLKILPWAVVIAMALMAVAMAAFPTFRAGVLNVLRINASDNTTWRFDDYKNESEGSQKAEASFEIELPNGFVVQEYYSDPLLESVYYQSISDSNSSFSVSVSIGSDAVIGINSENYTNHHFLAIRGLDGELFSDGNHVWITWADPSIPCCYMIESTNIEEETILQIAESIDYKE